MNAKATDIEIYLADTTAERCTDWLSTQFGTLTPRPRVKGMPKKALPFTAVWQQQSFLVLIFEQVLPGYTSIWLNCSRLPWPDDQHCALAAAKALRTQVRITAGGWQQQDDTDAWLEISPDGQVTTIQWQT